MCTSKMCERVQDILKYSNKKKPQQPLQTQNCHGNTYQ
jgi:hypothetical protein